MRQPESERERKDTVEKEFVSYPDTAADLLNVLLYQGREVVCAESLLPGPTETVYQGSQKLHSQYEDISEYVIADGNVRLMYLIANQSRKDSRMILRKAGYTGGVYRGQYEGKAAGVFPVIEIVLYWGRPHWKGNRTLKGFFQSRGFFGEEEEYMDDMKLHVFELCHLPRKTRELFRSDMRIVADYLAEREIKQPDRKVKHKAALVRLLAALSGETDLEEIENQLKELAIREEDEVTMAGIFTQYMEQGKTEGRAEGRAQELINCIESAVKNLHITLEEACEALGTTVGRYEEAKRII